MYQEQSISMLPFLSHLFQIPQRRDRNQLIQQEQQPQPTQPPTGRTLFVFDVDGVLLNFLGDGGLFPQAVAVLNYIKDANLGRMAIATRRENSGLAKSQVLHLLDVHRLRPFFEVIEFGNTNKCIHMQKIITQTGHDLKNDRLIFFDDDPVNLEQVREKFPSCLTIYIPSKIGLQFSDVPILNLNKRASNWIMRMPTTIQQQINPSSSQRQRTRAVFDSLCI